MNTKTGLLAGAILLAALGLGRIPASAATNDISHTLQRGLFEEEANHNFPAAVRAYESVISQVDSNRPLAATAVFRLGEIYRRQGKTNEASAQYERIVREFPDQEELAKLSHEHLPASTPATSPADGVTTSEFHGLDNQIIALRKLNPADQRIIVQQQYPNPVLTSLMQQKSETEQKLTELDKEFGREQPSVMVTQSKLQTINKQVDDQVAAVLRGLELRRDSLAASASGAGSQPSPKDSGNLSATEADEIKRIRELIKNSPDLINAPEQALMQSAASKGELEVVKLLLQNGGAVNELRQDDCTPLHYAAGNGRMAIVDFLLAHGAKPNAETGSGVTPLDLALYKGYEAVAKGLLTAGASVKTKVKSDTSRSGYVTFSFKAGQTPLHIIAQSGYSGLIPELLKQGLDLNAQDSAGRTALSYAVEKNNEPVVAALLAAGADVNLGSSPPLHLACLQDFQGLAELLLAKGADPNLEAPFEPNSIYSPVEIAVMHKRPEILGLLLKNKGNPNQRIKGVPLIFSTVAEPPLLKLLLEAGAKTDVHYGGVSPLEAAVRQNKILSAELLIAHGSLPTPAALFSAIRESTTNMVELLIKNRAGVNARESYEQTPLHEAVRSLTVANAKLLLDHYADPNLRNAGGETPLDLAKEMAHVGSQPYRPGFGSSVKSSDYVRPVAGELVILLREHGARDDLPHLDRIEVKRPSSGYSNFEFIKGTNDWNHFSLLEALACQYRIISTQSSGGVESRRGGGHAIWSGNLDYPNLENLIIHRPSPDGKGWNDVRVNALELLATGDCARDVWLQWGDVVEIPETDHPISERWQGMPEGTVSNLLQCVSRQITVRQKGSDNAIKLSPEYERSGTMSESSGVSPIYTARARSFMLRAVLDQMKLIRFSSDLTRVKITRRDEKTGKSQEWVIDCSSSDRPPTFWLRDGDVVEIPDKQ